MIASAGNELDDKEPLNGHRPVHSANELSGDQSLEYAEEDALHATDDEEDEEEEEEEP